MQQMGLEAIYPKPNLSKPNSEHKIYLYLLREVEINRVIRNYLTPVEVYFN